MSKTVEIRAGLLASAIACAAAIGAASPAGAVQPSVPDQRMDRYFSVWADDANVNPATVARIYARSVDYYGRPMSSAAVYRDKLAFIRQWPVRRYDVVPGSVGKSCDANETRCRVTAILRWSRADAAGRHAGRGANTVSLDLVREDGVLKIARESGSPVAGAACTGSRCAAFR